jgi:hypothetical protein
MALTTTECRFLQALVAENPASRASDVAASLCQHFGLGMFVRSRVHYSQADYAKAAQLLEANKVPLQRLPADSSRADAAAHSGQSEKSGSRPPHADSVGLRVLGRCEFEGNPVWAPAGGYLVWNVADATRIGDVDRLLVVENLETFREIERYGCVGCAALNVLVVFRGDRGLSAADSNSLLQIRSEPVWAFFDFDPAGLGMASGLPRLERLILPDAAWLSARLDGDRPRELYERSVAQWSAVLDEATQPQIKAAWALLRARRAGLSQEAMRDAPPPEVGSSR